MITQSVPTKPLPPDQQRLFEDGEKLLAQTQKNLAGLSDYSFIVSPFAKAYEGFLKDFFLSIKLIDYSTYESDHFRVGKTLNPSLRYKRYSIFQRLAEIDQNGEILAEVLWNAWKRSRNEIFHYFPSNFKKLTLFEAKERVELIKEAVNRANRFLVSCGKYCAASNTNP